MVGAYAENRAGVLGRVGLAQKEWVWEVDAQTKREGKILEICISNIPNVMQYTLSYPVSLVLLLVHTFGLGDNL
jgi:hypothetical protein